MKLSLFVSLLLAASFAAYAQSATSVDPDTGKRGDIITITGENLSKTLVAKVYLTDGGDGKGDIEVQITEQTDTTIKFKIPVKAAPGQRLALMILTATKPAQLIEQPVKVSIDDGTAQR